MARRRRRSSSSRRRGGASAWRKKFGAAGKACFKEGPTSAKEFGACMKRKLRK